MILKGNQRAGAKQLAIHLLRTDDNDHVEVHDIRGFVAGDLTGALREAYAISRATKCRQFLFSLSLSPPETENVPIAVFEKAIDDIEERLGLTDQPRAIVFHEKQGRRHAHCVWSRIDASGLRAINLPHYKLKLRSVSRQLYIDHGWHMPSGLVNSKERDPLNFSRAEWQQAKRASLDPRALKEMFQECWAASDSPKAFANALAARGFTLAQGDRRGYVAVDFRGEVYAVARLLNVRSKELKAKLPHPAELPSVSHVKKDVAERMTGLFSRHLDEANAVFDKRWKPLDARRARMVADHREARAVLDAGQSARTKAETLKRSQRLPRGLRAVWSWVTRRTARIHRENEREAMQAMARDAEERQLLVNAQLTERRRLQSEIRQVRHVHTREVARLHRDIAAYRPTAAPEQASSPDRNPRPKQRKRVEPSF